MVVSTTFTANFPVGPSERSAGIILGLYSDKAVFLIWYLPVSPHPDRNMWIGSILCSLDFI